MTARFVLPGDQVWDLSTASPSAPAQSNPAVFRIGPGIATHPPSPILTATRAGTLHAPPPPRSTPTPAAPSASSPLWVSPPSSTTRYTPLREDAVVCIVRDRHSDGYKVDLGGPEPGFLPALAFEGATKRNRPYLDVGAVVYARVVAAHRDFEPELSCAEVGESVKSWVTGETVYGELRAGGGPAAKGVAEGRVGCANVVSVPLEMARRMTMPREESVLTVLGDVVAFESVVGVNGRVWVSAESPRDVILISHALQSAVGADLAKEFVPGAFVMSTAHRPTWNPARGGDTQGGFRNIAPSQRFSSRDVPSQLTLKERRNDAPATTNDLDKGERPNLRKELEDREKAAAAKRSRITLPGAESNGDDDARDTKDDNSGDGYGEDEFPQDRDAELVEGDEDSSGDEGDEEEALLRELEQIKKECEEEKRRLEAEEQAFAERIRTVEAAKANPLLDLSGSAGGPASSGSFRVKRRWDDDVVFRNQAKQVSQRDKPRFVNDTIRNDFHRKFLNKYIR